MRRHANLQRRAALGGIRCSAWVRRAVIAHVLDDFIAHAWRRRSGHRQRGGVAQFVARLLQEEVVGAKVVAPQADTVRLVNHKEVQPGMAQRAQELALAQPFWRGIDQFILPLRDAGHAFGNLIIGQRAVNEGGAGTRRSRQTLHLVLHKCNQRANDERTARQHKRRQLVAERLARARGHDGQDRLATQHCRHRIRLSIAQRGEAKVARRLKRYASLLVPRDGHRIGAVNVTVDGGAVHVCTRGQRRVGGEQLRQVCKVQLPAPFALQAHGRCALAATQRLKQYR